jgi:hypothetical protein
MPAAVIIAERPSEYQMARQLSDNGIAIQPTLPDGPGKPAVA